MVTKMRIVLWLGTVALTVLLGTAIAVAQEVAPAAAAASPAPAYVERYHQAVGSWFGIATQVCQAGLAPVACYGGQPPTSLFMTPTLNADGNFIGNDTLTLAGAPFGPHTVAHGRWVPSSQSEFVADYVFMMNTFPPAEGTVSAVRFRWAAQVISQDTMVGYVNAYFVWGIPVKWARLAADAFPAYPSEANPIVTAPTTVYKDPGECKDQACPLIFKFTIKRVTF